MLKQEKESCALCIVRQQRLPVHYCKISTPAKCPHGMYVYPKNITQSLQHRHLHSLHKHAEGVKPFQSQVSMGLGTTNRLLPDASTNDRQWITSTSNQEMHSAQVRQFHRQAYPCFRFWLWNPPVLCLLILTFLIKLSSSTLPSSLAFLA